MLVNHTTTNYSAGWTMAIQSTQGICAFAGLVGNFLVIITLLRGKQLTKFAGSVFLHQTLMDFFVCLTSLLVILLQENTEVNTGYEFLDYIICHVWISQLVYWYFVFLSVQNLILIAMDRYYAVFRPVHYKQLGYRNAAICLIFLHAYSAFVNSADVFLVRFIKDNNTCESKHLFPGPVSQNFFHFYGILWFLLVYLFPVIAVLFLYSIIIFRLSQHKICAASKSRQRVASEITKTAVIITVIFIVCFSYDSIYYLLGNVDILDYEFNTPAQTMGVFLVALNSCVNPLVYCIVMRAFRRQMTKSVCCCLLSNRMEEENIAVYDYPSKATRQLSSCNGDSTVQENPCNPVCLKLSALSGGSSGSNKPSKLSVAQQHEHNQCKAGYRLAFHHSTWMSMGCDSIFIRDSDDIVYDQHEVAKCLVEGVSTEV